MNIIFYIFLPCLTFTPTKRMWKTHKADVEHPQCGCRTPSRRMWNTLKEDVEHPQGKATKIFENTPIKNAENTPKKMLKALCDVHTNVKLKVSL